MNGSFSCDSGCLLVNTHDGMRSVFCRTSFPFLGLGYEGWDFLLRLDELEERMIQEINGRMPLRSVLFIGMCKDSICALMLATRLRRSYPALPIGVWGCAWAADCTGKTPSCKGMSLSPVHEAIRLKEPYKTLLRVADPLRLLDDPATQPLHLFAFYCRHPYWTMDEEAIQRLKHRLTETYVHDADERQSMAEVHTKILKLARFQPQLVSSWILDMFRRIEGDLCAGNITRLDEMPD